jgi:hypothetical protein
MRGYVQLENKGARCVNTIELNDGERRLLVEGIELEVIVASEDLVYPSQATQSVGVGPGAFVYFGGSLPATQPQRSKHPWALGP